MLDVPRQYKPLIDAQTYALFDAARWLMAIVGELGAETYEAKNDLFKIKIEKVVCEEDVGSGF